MTRFFHKKDLFLNLDIRVNVNHYHLENTTLVLIWYRGGNHGQNLMPLLQYIDGCLHWSRRLQYSTNRSDFTLLFSVFTSTPLRYIAPQDSDWVTTCYICYDGASKVRMRHEHVEECAGLRCVIDQNVIFDILCNGVRNI